MSKAMFIAVFTNWRAGNAMLSGGEFSCTERAIYRQAPVLFMN
ncbi:MAG: hypothetical protein ACLRP3_04675 [Escherichia sp.]|nr:hypothetical protein HMPREF1569_0477 [Klebsiella oxytoca OK-1]